MVSSSQLPIICRIDIRNFDTQIECAEITKSRDCFSEPKKDTPLDTANTLQTPIAKQDRDPRQKSLRFVSVDNFSVDVDFALPLTPVSRGGRASFNRRFYYGLQQWVVSFSDRLLPCVTLTLVFIWIKKISVFHPAMTSSESKKGLVEYWSTQNAHHSLMHRGAIPPLFAALRPPNCNWRSPRAASRASCHDKQRFGSSCTRVKRRSIICLLL